MTNFNNEYEHLEWFLDTGLTHYQELKEQIEDLKEYGSLEEKERLIRKLEDCGDELKEVNKRLNELKKQAKENLEMKDNREIKTYQRYLCLLVNKHNELGTLLHKASGYSGDEIDQQNELYMRDKLKKNMEEIKEIDNILRTKDKNTMNCFKYKLVKFSLEKGFEFAIYGDSYEELYEFLIDRGEKYEKTLIDYAKSMASDEFETGMIADYDGSQGYDEEDLIDVAMNLIPTFNEMDYNQVLNWNDDIILYMYDKELKDFVINDLNTTSIYMRIWQGFKTIDMTTGKTIKYTEYRRGE